MSLFNKIRRYKVPPVDSPQPVSANYDNPVTFGTSGSFLVVGTDTPPCDYSVDTGCTDAQAVPCSTDAMCPEGQVCVNAQYDPATDSNTVTINTDTSYLSGTWTPRGAATDYSLQTSIKYHTLKAPEWAKFVVRDPDRLPIDSLPKENGFVRLFDSDDKMSCEGVVAFIHDNKLYYDNERVKNPTFWKSYDIHRDRPRGFGGFSFNTLNPSDFSSPRRATRRPSVVPPPPTGDGGTGR